LTSLFISLLVIGRIAAACWSNVLQKRALNVSELSGEPPSALELLVAIWTLTTIFLTPWWGYSVYTTVRSLLAPESVVVSQMPAFWGWMVLAAAVEVPGNFLLLRSIQRTDLSIFGPLNSYKPIVGMLLGWWILAELPTVYGVLGMVIVLVGSLLLADHSSSPSEPCAARQCLGLQHQGVRDRLIAVVLTASGSIFLKLAMQYQGTLASLAVWSFLSWFMALGWLVSNCLWVKCSPGNCLSWTRQFAPAAMLPQVISIAASMMVMQGLTILAFQAMHVGYALALFQLGSLVSVYLGHRLFGEVDFWRRLAAAFIMFAGAVVIMLAG
jgi:drug/metabolite transporter (DMT)-like permease